MIQITFYRFAKLSKETLSGAIFQCLPSMKLCCSIKNSVVQTSENKINKEGKDKNPALTLDGFKTYSEYCTFIND